MLHSVHKTSCFHISVNSCHPKNSETKIFFGPFTECERFKSIQNKQYWQTYLITFKPITPVCLHACVRLPVALSYSASRPLLEEDIHFTATWPGLTSSNEQPSVPTRINSSVVKTRRPLRVVFLMRFCAENPHLGGDWRHRRYFIQEQEVLHHGTISVIIYSEEQTEECINIVRIPQCDSLVTDIYHSPTCDVCEGGADEVLQLRRFSMDLLRLEPTTTLSIEIQGKREWKRN